MKNVIQLLTRNVRQSPRALIGTALVGLMISGAINLSSTAAPRPTTSKANKCSAIIAGADDLASRRKLVYPKGINPSSHPEGFMMIGYESEYGFKEAAALLRDYAPKTSEMSHEEWLSKTDRQRLEWIQSRFAESPEQATDAGLYKIYDNEHLPEKLIVDGTGNLEIVMAPKNSYEEWEAAVDSIVERYGPGSQQAMISKPLESAFGASGVAAKKQSALIDQHFGWLIYTNLFDTYARMKAGFLRFEADETKSKQVLQPFNHPFLGPMTKARRDMMEDYLRNNATGGRYTDNDMFMVTKRDRSFKYSGGPAYRPDIAKGVRWSWETRNAHKDVNDLKRKVKRDFVAHANGLEVYAKFSKVPAFDALAEYEKLPRNVQTMLERLFPSKADPRWPYALEDRQALEVYRNFSFPAQDLTVFAQTLTHNAQEKAALVRSIAAARTRYLTLLTDMAREPNINDAAAQAKVQGALAQFAVDSGISAALENLAHEIGHDGGVVPEENVRTNLPRAAGQ